ncbi:3-deoxy-D-manno-octulosonic acid transferase, partial [bacterium]|nr:3-deoxy-D-manno-octulosonic acid transferase [bacterium]
NKTIVAGSTHKREDEIILKVFCNVKEKVPPARLIIAPRYPSRAPALAVIARQLGLKCALRSQQEFGPEYQVYILDTLGELSSYYASGEVAIIGGTIANIGGHNPLEPAIHGKPIVFGPFYSSTLESSDLLLEAGAAKMVSNRKELEYELINLLQNPALARQRGIRAFETVERLKHIGDLYTEAIAEALK